MLAPVADLIARSRGRAVMRGMNRTLRTADVGAGYTASPRDTASASFCDGLRARGFGAGFGAFIASIRARHRASRSARFM